MTALLRYVWLKSLRDQSLFAFLFVPMLIPVAALGGATLGKGWHYPFFMNAQYTPEQNAALATSIGMTSSVIFASISAFWIIRPEIITRSIGSLALATRSWNLVAAPIAFSAGIAFMAWICSVGLVSILTAAVPSHLGLLTLRLAAGCLGASAAGLMVLTISPQPAMVVGAYLGCVVVMMLVVKTAPALLLPATFVAIVICTATAMILMERRCAS